ncbi:MAG TPA: nucleoside 2-deoxyribosyltransferase [Actinomycetota bacterium]|nr:nucleoside 2-deoxyribosyltransferase [Actinomycetota bacterium]
MIQAPAVYVASPLGFSVPTRMYYEQELLARLAAAGFTILDPWDGVTEAAAGPPDVMAIGARNAAMIDRAAGVLAVLDGPDVDSGTAAEIGYAAARGIRVVGLRTDIRQSGEEGAAVNLQVEYFVRVSGGTIAGSLQEAVAALAGLVRQG